MEIIEIKWEGPYSIDEIKKLSGPTDYGVYQVYSAHNIHGPDTLLYIGKANKQTFAERIPQHKEWIDWESSVRIYVGRLGGVDRIEDKKWGEMINNAEKLLNHFSAPPYNLKHINDYGEIYDTIVLNFGEKHKLLIEYSTFVYQSEFFNDNESEWEAFNEKE